ncbi:MAG: hypothetical protein Q7S05_04745 [bacterium]|nr:hypothetical protein [bacterium]
MKKLFAILALCASVVPSANADEFGRAFRGAAGATAGVVIVGSISCAVTRAFMTSTIALCSPNQLRQAGYGQQGYGGYQQQHRARYVGRVYVERPATTAAPATSQLPTLDEAVAKATAALGGKPTDGRKYGGVSVLAEGAGFKCPNGQTAQRVKHVAVQGYDLDRWFCP